MELPEDLPVRNNIVRATYTNPDMFRGFASLSGRVHSASHLPDRIRERAALEYAGAVDTRSVDDNVWERARAHYSEIELVDMTQLAAFYALAARVAVALEIEPDA